MSASEESLALLRSIDASLKQLVKLVGARAPKSVASDRDLDGKYGNPKVTFMPRDWTGQSYKGATFSECPPDLLDMVAETLDYFADQAEAKNELTEKGKPVAGYKRSDAARARGWAKRIRDGKHTPSTPDAGGDDDESSGDTEGEWTSAADIKW